MDEEPWIVEVTGLELCCEQQLQEPDDPLLQHICKNT